MATAAVANHGEGLAARSVPHLRLCAGGTPHAGKKRSDFSGSLPTAPNWQRHRRAIGLGMQVEQTRCSGASKPLLAVGVGRDGTALLDLMVGEPLAHVQGFSPKGHGAV